MADKRKFDVNGSTADETRGERPKVRDVEEIGREVVAAEIRGLHELRLSIGAEFRKAVALLLECQGKVIVCGMGKSGIVARKIAATLSSTGTPAVYLHPGEAAHGDMGMITKDDIFLAVSKSGKNDEITKLLPYLKAMKVKMIAITATEGSPLADECEIVLLTMAEKEACPMDIVPTTSTTSAMVLGDALAVAALQSRDFSKEDFARLHPSGVLGK
ncbi:MAG: KpsF/GutQ family sugar-phosphate isomerase, partial [Candidatus Krumholzibacteriaceae bacterium]